MKTYQYYEFEKFEDEKVGQGVVSLAVDPKIGDEITIYYRNLVVTGLHNIEGQSVVFVQRPD